MPMPIETAWETTPHGKKHKLFYTLYKIIYIDNIFYFSEKKEEFLFISFVFYYIYVFNMCVCVCLPICITDCVYGYMRIYIYVWYLWKFNFYYILKYVLV